MNLWQIVRCLGEPFWRSCRCRTARHYADLGLAMWSFLTEFMRRSSGPYQIVVVEEGDVNPPRQYRVWPQKVFWAYGGSLAAVVLLTTALLAFTPVRGLVLGAGVEMQRDARLNALRLAALQDSLETQEQYVAQLRQLFSGEIDTASVPQSRSPQPSLPNVTSELEEIDPEPRSEDWSDHQQPALSVGRVSAGGDEAGTMAGDGSLHYLPSLQLPVLPPVDGFRTRGFDARTGHYAVDIAVEKGTMVRSIGDGYVIMSDWTHDGGYALAIQHADGYVSVYKHNERLLKRVGDRVRDREAVAISGNSGEITTGPHLHFELWKNGLAQDPGSYFIGW